MGGRPDAGEDFSLGVVGDQLMESFLSIIDELTAQIEELEEMIEETAAFLEETQRRLHVTRIGPIF